MISNDLRCPRRFFLMTAAAAAILASRPGGAQAATWTVDPSMGRPAIQAVIDGASNGDTVLFLAGAYDWSDTPLSYKWENTGAIVIQDKTLTIKGAPGAVLVGRPSIDGTTGLAQGINAFVVIDQDLNNDVTFDGLLFQTFLRGVRCGWLSSRDPANGDEVFEPNLRNLTVVNCIFRDMHRESVSVSNLGGNALVRNNDMTGPYIALFVDWYWSPGRDWQWQPEGTIIQCLGNRVYSPGRGFYFCQTRNVAVSDNTVAEAGVWAIEMNRTYLGAVMSGNVLSRCWGGILLVGPAIGATVERNELTDILDRGISLRTDDAAGNVISRNRIAMAAGSRWAVLSNAKNNFYGQNKIRGAGELAFCLYGEETEEGRHEVAHHEIMQGNSVDGFTPVYCYFYFDPTTHDNLVVGSGMDTNTFYDEGVNNRITGGTSVAGGIGQDLRKAILLRNDTLKEAREILRH